MPASLIADAPHPDGAAHLLNANRPRPPPFRHNRRSTPMAGFQTLLGLGLTHEPITYRDISDRAA